MYAAYWGFDRAPFETGADPAFYYPSEGHQAALLQLRYAIEQRKGAAALAGERGAGKTLLVELLRQQLSEHIAPFIHVVFPQMPAPDLLAYLCGELTGDAERAGRGVEANVRTIQRTLARNTESAAHAVVILDEAHLIDQPACWDTLRLLLNFQSDARNDLTLVLVGQTALLSRLERMPVWHDWLSVLCVLKPLSLDETACYLQHRLRAAGCDRELFTAEAVAAIHRIGQGFPRRMNRLADLALVVGYAEQLPQIGPEEIEAIALQFVPRAA